MAVRSSVGAAEEEARVVLAALAELDRADVAPQGIVLALRAADRRGRRSPARISSGRVPRFPDFMLATPGGSTSS
jgi:hypothetical protein